MICLYLLYFQGIPRPLPLNKNRVNRDSFINDEDDVIRESFTVSKSKSIEDTEEFRKAVESFDQMFGGDTSGCPTPDVKRISLMESRKSSETPASPNLNWKRIKTSKSFEAEETSQHQESFMSSSNVETREESMTTQSFQSSEIMEKHSHVVQEQFESYSEQRQESYCQEQSISSSTTTQESSTSSSEKKKSKKNRKKSRERNVENAGDVQNAPEISEEKQSKSKHKHERAEKVDDLYPDLVDDGEAREHKISLIGEHYKGEEESVIDVESIKNVDGTAKQRKGSSKFSKKQREKSRSPSRSNRNSLHNEGFEDVDLSSEKNEDVPGQEGVLS